MKLKNPDELVDLINKLHIKDINGIQIVTKGKDCTIAVTAAGAQRSIGFVETSQPILIKE